MSVVRRPDAVPRAFVVFWLSVFAVVLIRTAWIGDDAYITFRTIDNFVHGYGLRWNVAERVQAYTHPLWMALIALFYSVTGEPYFTALSVSIALTLATLWLLIRTATSLPLAAAGLTILLCSRAFIDYSTSGLENPLTSLLLVLFVACYTAPRARPFALWLIAAAIMLTRLDAGLLVLPALALRMYRDRRPGDLKWAAAGLLPLVAWELFSLVYYGVPFPNTGYAKLHTAIAERELVRQGLLYLLDSIQVDPVTPIAITAIAIWTLVDSPRGLRPLAVGIVIGVVYVTSVGGDFMSGRMLEAPLLLAVAVMVGSGAHETLAFRYAFPALVAVLGFNALDAAFLRAADAGAPLTATGITDERMYYFPATGLVNYRRGGVWPRHSWVTNGLQLRAAGAQVVVNCCNGMLGYYAGPQVHIIDSVALADPLLSRLPAEADWRIGHFGRAIPRGYIETLESGSNRLSDPNLAAYYDRLSIVMRGAIWNTKRLAAVWRLDTGRYDHWLRAASAPPAACEYRFLLASEDIAPTGGNYDVIATAAVSGHCRWTASTPDAWVHVASAPSGVGVAEVRFTAEPNARAEPRVASIAVAFDGGATTMAVRQDGTTRCSYAVAPSDLALPASGMSSMFEVKPSDPSCAWKAQPDANWISIAAGGDNTGTGVVQLVVRPNDTPTERVAHVTVSGTVTGTGTLIIRQRGVAAGR